MLFRSYRYDAKRVLGQRAGIAALRVTSGFASGISLVSVQLRGVQAFSSEEIKERTLFRRLHDTKQQLRPDMFGVYGSKFQQRYISIPAKHPFTRWLNSLRPSIEVFSSLLLQRRGVLVIREFQSTATADSVLASPYKFSFVLCCALTLCYSNGGM